MTTFLNARYDDQVDSTTQFLNRAEENQQRPTSNWILDSAPDKNPGGGGFMPFYDDYEDDDEDSYPD